MGPPPSPGCEAARGGRGPLEYKVRLTHGSTHAQLSSRVLQGFLQGEQSHDNTVLTAITVGTVSFFR